MTKHAYVDVSGQTVKTHYQAQIKQVIQAAEQACYACARQPCFIRLSKRTKHRPSNTRTKEMSQVVWSKVWWPSNLSICTKQGGQTVEGWSLYNVWRCLVTRHFLFVQALWTPNYILILEMLTKESVLTNLPVCRFLNLTERNSRSN